MRGQECGGERDCNKLCTSVRHRWWRTEVTEGIALGVYVTCLSFVACRAFFSPPRVDRL